MGIVKTRHWTHPWTAWKSVRVNVLTVLLSRSALIALFALYPAFVICWYSGFFLLLIGVLVAVFSMEVICKRGRLWFDIRPVPVYVFFAVPLASVLWARYPADTLWHGSLVLANMAIFYLASRANAEDSTKLISRLSVVIPLVMLVAFGLIWKQYGSVRPHSREMADVIGSFANLASALVVLIVPYLLVFLYEAKRKPFMWITLITAILVVLLSQSRGAYVMLIISVFLTLLLLPDHLNKRIILICKLTGVASVMVIMLFLFVDVDRIAVPVVERFQQSQLLDEGWGEPVRGEADYKRALMYTQGLDLIREEALLGIGYGGFSRYIEERNGIFIVSHNLIISVWGEMGIPGMTALIWLLTSAFVKLHRQRNNQRLPRTAVLMATATLVALVVAVLHSMFRPLLTNPLLPIILAQVYARGGFVLAGDLPAIFWMRNVNQVNSQKL
jgi:O-antigen ligase